DRPRRIPLRLHAAQGDGGRAGQSGGRGSRMTGLTALLAQTAPPVDTRIPVPKVDWLAVGPEVALIAAAMVLVLMAALNRGRRDLSSEYLFVGLGGVAASGLITIKL